MLALAASVLLLQDQGRLVATLPEGIEVHTVHFRQFGSIVGYVARKGEDQWAVLGDWRTKPGLIVQDCLPSRDGRTAVVLGHRLEKNKPVGLILLKDQIIDTFPDPEIREWSWGRHPGCITDDGTAVVYLVSRGKGQDRRVSVSFTGQREKGSYENCSIPVISGDGQTVAHTGGNDDKSWVVVNEARGPEFDEVTLPAVSRRNSVVAYGANQGKDWFLIVGTKKTRVDLNARFRSVFINADGTAAGYCEERREDDGGKQKFFNRVVVDGRKGEEFSLIESESLHPDGKTVLYKARGLDRKKYVVVGDRKFEVPDGVGDPEFSPDGRKAGYGVRKGRELRWIEVDLPN